MSCPSELELARVVSGDDDPHVAACASCRAFVAQQREAIALARMLGGELPPASQREEMRTAILARSVRAVPVAPRRWRAVAGAALGCAAAAAVVLILMHRGGGHEVHGTVHAGATAEYTISAPPDEVVRLVEGRVDIEVSPLGEDERFRVVVGDAEIEVRGTEFAVTAHGDHLVSVEVVHGRVDVHPHAHPATTLGAGESWTAPVVAAAPPAALELRHEARAARLRDELRHEVPAVVAPVPRPVPAPPPPSKPAVAVAEPPPEPPPAPPKAPARTAAAIAYDDAWTAMRRNDFAAAARGFTRVLAHEPGPLTEDAAYYMGVALARAKLPAQAIPAFRDFLDAYPRSHHAGEASAILGWLLVDRRELDEAARRFRAAVDDASPSVRASARSGLDALHR